MRLLLLVSILFPLLSFSQLTEKEGEIIDKLKDYIKNAKHDSDKVNAYTDWDNIIYQINPKLDEELNKKIEELCLQNLDLKSLNHQERTFFEKAISTSYNNLGIIYSDQANYQLSLAYYNKSLRLCQEHNDTIGESMIYNNIGNVYSAMGDDDEGLKYCQKSLELDKKMNYLKGWSSSLTNIGNIYSRQGNNKKAMEYYQQSLVIDKKLEDESGIATCYNNIGSIHQYNNNYEKALEYFKKGLEIRRKNDNKQGIAYSLNALAGNFLEQKKYDLAIKNATEALTLSQEIDELFEIKEAASILYESYKAQKNYKLAHDYYEHFISARDSLNRIDNQKAIIRQDVQHEYDKQKAIDDLENEKKVAIAKEEEKQQTLISYFAASGLILVIIFSIVIFQRLRVTRNQKSIIEKQKNEIEITHKEITDSINYAKRIQKSFLATQQLLDENLQEYFVLFKPKDVVSGDFYWAGKLSNGNFALVNADSTGHGVPGAIMSILNISSIEKAIEENINKPEDIFNRARSIIINRLKKDGSEDGGKDGMDASLVSFDFKNNKMYYVAAQNPIWIVRNKELIIIKPEKMPVGKHNKDNIPFIGGETNINKNDIIYTITDGFQDQFGGNKGKKFMVKRLREYILSISHLSLTEQKEKLDKTFNDWKGNLEQVDDICIIGIRV